MTIRRKFFNHVCHFSALIALALAACASSALHAEPTPPPTPGPIDVWFKAPASGATVSGTLNMGSSCYVKGTGVASVAFFLDSSALNTVTNVTNGMQCLLDTTKFSNGTHQLKATAYDSAGASSNDVININIQNGGSSSAARAVPTFESLGLYWTPPNNPGEAGCPVRYRKVGDSAWKDGLAMWYDARNNECRGSIVLLEPGTSYEVQLSMPSGSPSTQLTATTWSESFPIAQTITLPAGTTTQPLIITQGGSPSGYVLYQAASGGTTVDVQNAQPNNIKISAPYVIVRGLTLKGAQASGIALIDGAHDVVIEDNDISGWGRYNYTNSRGWQIGVDYDAGIYAECNRAQIPFERAVIQRNKIHHPRYGANSWSWGHPAGPQAITFSYCAGNHVIRYNEIYSSDEQHYFNDGIGGEEQESDAGFPNYDSDIYGNQVSHVWDDAIEAEGAVRNVRIWGNYLDKVAVGIATATVNRGPVYVFRNVQNRSRQLSERAPDDDDRNNFAKSGRNSTTGYGGGRRYVFHNTLLQATDPSASLPLGAGGGLQGANGPMINTVSRNNILHIWKDWWGSIANTGWGIDAGYDLYNGTVSVPELNGIRGTPVYQSGNGWTSESGGKYALAPASPGYDAAVRIPNFNDNYMGAGPDIGAHEAGTPPMKFGVAAGGGTIKPPPPEPTVDFYCSFQNSATDCGFTEQARVPGRASPAAVGRDTGKAVRLNTQPGDNNVNGSGPWERNDLALSQADTDCYAGREQWWGHSTMLPDDFVVPPVGGGGIVMDFHHTGSSGQANFEVQVMPEPIGIRMRGYGGPTVNQGRFEATVGPVEKNVWYDFIYHVKWSSGSDGFFDAWVNGVQVLAHRGPTLYAGMGCYLKLANYHSPFGQPTSVLHDEIYRGANWDVWMQ